MRVLGLSVIVGIVAGLAAVVFYVATEAAAYYALDGLAGYRPEPHPGGEIRFSWMPPTTRPFRPWLLAVIPTVGGLAAGLLIFTFAPEAEGHGTDSVIEAYHQRQGFMRPRVPVVKIIASALTIGSGGSGGREGPIAQIGAGFGSVLADMLRLRPIDRRILLAAGMGAGIGAIFRAPVAGALFAAEVLYSSPEFEPEVILPAALASVIAYSTFGAVFGWTPLFTIPELEFADPLQLLAYTVLALAMVPAAMLYTRTFYGLTALFRRLPGPRHIRPAIGGLLTGLIGLALYYYFGDQRALSVLAFGYAAVQGALLEPESMGALLLLAVALGKLLTTSLTIGSGGSGGVFGPSMIIGGCLGGALGLVLNEIAPSLVPEPSAFAVVGMAGFFAAAAKTPFSTMIIVSEMTGGYLLLLPALWVCTLSFMLSDRQSIYRNQVDSRTRSPAHQGSFVRQALAGVNVRKFMTTANIQRLRPGDSLAEVLNEFDEATIAVMPVVDDENRLLGIVDLEEVYLASHTPALRPLVIAADLMRTEVHPATPDDSLEKAYELFIENELQALPVVNDRKEMRVLGLVRRHDIASAYLRLLYGPSRATEASAAVKT
ncbi:MAG: CBS domain-containing protein [Planctomycetota bacterium]|nr:MAG: CBS domain-containing protein [Planctomycetota bacterium]